MTEEELGKYPTVYDTEKDGHRWRYFVTWKSSKLEDGKVDCDIVKQDLGPIPPSPPPPSPEEVAARVDLRERMNAFLVDLEELTRKHGLAVGNSCGLYEPDEGSGHYTVHEAPSYSNMMGDVWAGLDVTWREGEPDGERVEIRDDD
jgi:hypothetical protein